METDNLGIRVPLNGTFELTARCNLRCKMCLIRIDDERMKELGGRERTTDEWLHMAKEVQEAGTLGLLLTGGEPLLRSDFDIIYEEIARMGFILSLYTNATLITPKLMEVLEKYPPHRIGITVYGASPGTYEKVTGSADAYERMVIGVKQLAGLPSKLTIRTTIIKDNLKDLDRIAKWAESFDAEFNITRIVTKVVRGGIADVEECRLTPRQSTAMLKARNIEKIVKPLYNYINDNPQFRKEDYEPELLEDHVIMPDYFKGRMTDGKQTIYGCEAGMSSYCITWDGKIVGCQLLGDCWTYPFEEGFEKAWREFPLKVERLLMPAQCMECSSPCSACPATRLAETGHKNGFSDYLCNESKLIREMEESLMSEIHQNIK